MACGAQLGALVGNRHANGVLLLTCGCTHTWPQWCAGQCRHCVIGRSVQPQSQGAGFQKRGLHPGPGNMHCRLSLQLSTMHALLDHRACCLAGRRCVATPTASKCASLSSARMRCACWACYCTGCCWAGSTPTPTLHALTPDAWLAGHLAGMH